ncbi:MAG: hypothetical protein WC222_04050 [Parachlamydiales bacterium]
MKILLSVFFIVIAAQSPLKAAVGDDDWRASVRVENKVQQQKRDAWDIQNKIIEQQRDDWRIQERRLEDRRWEQKQYDLRRGK